MSWLPLPDPRYPTCKMGINDLYLFPGSLGERALPTEMLFAVILTNQLDAGPAQSPGPTPRPLLGDYHLSSERRRFPNLCPHAFKSFSASDPVEGQGGSSKSERAQGAVRRLVLNGDAGVNLHPLPPHPTVLHPQRELLSKKSPGTARPGCQECPGGRPQGIAVQ